MISVLGYDYYKQKKRFSEWHNIENVTLKDGFQDLVEQLKEKHPEALKKDYLCVSFVGDPMTVEDRERWYDFMDSTEIRQNKTAHLKHLKQLDSVAGIYNKNIVHIFAFKRSDEDVSKFILENKNKFKNILFIDGQKTLFSGYFNDKKQGSGFMHAYFVLDKNGKLVYDCPYIINEHVYFSKFLKTLPN